MPVELEIYKSGGPHQGAYDNGVLAGYAGISRRRCPYDVVRKGKRVTWALGFRKAWLKGWAEGQQKRAARDL